MEETNPDPDTEPERLQIKSLHLWDMIETFHQEFKCAIGIIIYEYAQFSAHWFLDQVYVYQSRARACSLMQEWLLSVSVPRDVARICQDYFTTETPRMELESCLFRYADVVLGLDNPDLLWHQIQDLPKQIQYRYYALREHLKAQDPVREYVRDLYEEEDANNLDTLDEVLEYALFLRLPGVCNRVLCLRHGCLCKQRQTILPNLGLLNDVVSANIGLNRKRKRTD